MNIAFKRRIGPDPHEGGKKSAGASGCPDILELDNGDIAVIGIDITAQASGVLPPTADRRLRPGRTYRSRSPRTHPRRAGGNLRPALSPTSRLYSTPQRATRHAVGFSLDWIDANWFSLLQTAGIVAGFVFTGVSIRRESRSRRVQNLLTITEHHRTLWQQVFESKSLLRVLSRKVNLKRRPVTPQEVIFVNLIILHLTGLLEAMRHRQIEKPAGLDTDIGDFFSRPVPRKVWQDNLQFRDERTRRYVESLLPAQQSKTRRAPSGRSLSRRLRLR